MLVRNEEEGLFILFQRCYVYEDMSTTTPRCLVREIMIRHLLRPQFGTIANIIPFETLENHILSGMRVW